MITKAVRKTELNKKFLVMSLWAKRFGITYFPFELKSMSLINPTSKQVKKDYEKLSKFDNHPAFITFCLGYNPNINCNKES